MSAMSYLWRHPKTSVYYFRRGVPARLRPVIGKTMIQVSLGTKDVAEAKPLAMKKAAEVDKQFRDAAAPVEAKAELSAVTIARLAEIHLAQVLEEDEAVREEGLSERDYRKQKETLDFVDEGGREELARGRLTMIVGDVDELLEQNGLSLDKNSPSYRKLAYAVLKANVTAIDLMQKRHAGEVVETPKAPSLGGIEKAGTPTISDALTKWEAETERRPKTVHEWRLAIRRFKEAVGEDIPVNEITPEHVSNFVDALKRIPRVLSAKQRRLPVPELLEEIGDAKVAKLSPDAVRKQTSAISSVLRVAKRHRWIAANPVQDLLPPKGKGKRRLPYDAADLKLIFEQSPLYTDPKMPRNARFWLPLLALFTGARVGELGQALVEDVKNEDGIDYLDLNTEHEGKSLKTQGSHRKVPLHPELIKCGFLHYVRGLRKKGERRLFPELKAEKNGQWTKEFTRWWNSNDNSRGYVRQLGITSRMKSFHSFRHTFIDAARKARMQEQVRDAITGHANGSVGRGYGDGEPLDVLAEAIATVGYPINLHALQIR